MLKTAALYFAKMEDQGHPPVILNSVKSELLHACRDYAKATKVLKSFDERHQDGK